MAKTVYSWFIQNDLDIPNTLVRSSTMSEELGRVSYMLSDKTGTLTQNEMVFKRLHLGTVSFGCDSMDELMSHLNASFRLGKTQNLAQHVSIMRRTIVTRIRDAIEALALCHNVTPVHDEANTSEIINKSIEEMGEQLKNIKVTYQASSPDEVLFCFSIKF